MTSDQAVGLEAGSHNLRPTPREWMIFAVSVLVGLLFVGLVGLAGSKQVVASALVDAGPGGSTESVLNVSPDVANRYVQTELVYIDILQPEFAKAIEAAGMESVGVISARQEGPTSIVRISAQTGEEGLSARQANIAAEVYIDDWRARATADLRRLEANTQARIDAITKRLNKLGGSANDRAEARGLRQELTRLTQELSDLKFRQGGVGAANRLVEEAKPQTAVTNSSVPLYALLGLVLGALVGIGLVIYRRVRHSAERATLPSPDTSA